MKFCHLHEVACAARGLLVLVCLPTAAVVAADRPNIVVIMSDDAGYADWGFMDQFTGGQTQFKTPNLDQLAAQSVVASNAYAASATCAISRAGMLTGRHPERFGFSYNVLAADEPREGFPVDQVTLPERLKQLNYSTALIGKWHLGEQPQWQPQSQGLDYFFGVWEGAASYFQNTSYPNQIRRGTAEVPWWSEPSFNNIPPDPVNGRYATDAFGDEASKYIADHAGDSQPFFLYTAFTGPHSPFTAKQQDLDQFNNTNLSATRKTSAAMTLALDRAVGNILSRINDPNGDGNESDSIADNTIIVFTNDNGGDNPSYHDNGPLAGAKATAYEGGVRVPFMIKAPGAAPGVWDQLISGMDLYPTLIAAAGGTVTTPIDGVNLMPYLAGAQTGDVHDAIFHRNRVNFASVRKGDWKLVKGDTFEPWKLFHLNPDGTGEDVDLLEQEPDKVQELVREYVAFDVGLDKARNSTSAKVHDNDVFVRRNDIFANANWRFAQSWLNGDTGQVTGISKDDPSPNMVLVFKPNDAADYRSTNVANRASGIAWSLLDAGEQDIPGLGEVMLNEIRLEGPFTGAANRKATIEGKPLLFVNNLAGKSPGLRLDATQAAGGFNYTYQLDLDLILYHDFVIEGNGNATFNIGGVMRNFYQPSGVRKRGTSTVTLTGHNTFTGPAILEGGRVIVNGPDAALDGPAEVTVQAGARLTLQNGLIRTGRLDVSQGTFDFLGGTLQAEQVVGNLANSAGAVIVGATPTATVSGNFLQTGGMLKTLVDGHLPSPSETLLSVAGQAQLGGTLAVEFDGTSPFPVGSSLRLLQAAGGIVGTFSQVQWSMLPAGSQWAINYSANSVTLSRLANVFDSADFDADGDVDGADFLRWQRSVGSSGPAGDANGDGLVNGLDLNSWKSQYGSVPPSSSSQHQIPEPSGLLLGAFAALVGLIVTPIVRQRS